MEHAKKYILVDQAVYSRNMSIANPAITLSQNRISQLNHNVSDILEGDAPDDVKAKQYSMAMQKTRVREPIKQEEEQVDDTEILESVPSAVHHKATRLLRIVKKSQQLSWNGRGELIYNQTAVPGSSIVELFIDILRNRKVGEERPLGWLEFAEGLSESPDISKELVSNYSSWKVINRNKPVSTAPVAPATVDVTQRLSTPLSSAQSRRSREPSRRSRAYERPPMLQRMTSWDPYLS